MKSLLSLTDYGDYYQCPPCIFASVFSSLLLWFMPLKQDIRKHRHCLNYRAVLSLFALRKHCGPNVIYIYKWARSSPVSFSGISTGGTETLLRHCVMENYSNTTTAMEFHINVSGPGGTKRQWKIRQSPLAQYPPAVFVLRQTKTFILFRSLGHTEYLSNSLLASFHIH